MTPVHFIQQAQWREAPAAVRQQVKLSLMDLIAVAVAGRHTKLGSIAVEVAGQAFPGTIPILFRHNTASAAGAAMANGMIIDSVDAHDGFNLSKGHVGCPVVAAALPMAMQAQLSGEAFLTAMLIGYEIGARAAIAQHATVPDYHTSGSWGAVAASALGSRIVGLSELQTLHALGIAEYHGPRSQMMRCIDHPTMVKDGSGWGAMCGVTAVQFAAAGFSGAPAITVTEATEYWQDLGKRWYMLEQYYKPYPVCRWAQAPVEAALALQRQHRLAPQQIEHIRIESFHESIRLAVNDPVNTEQAQYSTSYPVAVALVKGDITPQSIGDHALTDPLINRLAKCIQMQEHPEANAAFPSTRLAKVAITLKSGETLYSDWHEPRWDHTNPPSAAELEQKYWNYTGDYLERQCAQSILNVVRNLENEPLSALGELIFKDTSMH
ncbi:MAG: MmgE/PrpD family protein [Gammaproteobacteria bacterium]|nr:MmgE/PrpD family protein [Gammaproteobacteria bacterium]